MVKVFNLFIAATFFLSQVVSVNASHLRNASHKEEPVNYVVEQVKDTTSTAVNVAALHIPAVSYGTITEDTANEGSFEKVVDPLTVTAGIMAFGFAINTISAVIGWIKDIISIFR
ncbi:hypothetical protein [Bartonella pachyuromydis]|uniref:Uncharacterized protein n=1 Tax=Bartonella pachyuromydis TaxID=931097 RepID=A0ABP8VCX2_9HYPH